MHAVRRRSLVPPKLQRSEGGTLVLEQSKSVSEAAGPCGGLRAAWRASRHRRYTLDPVEAI